MEELELIEIKELEEEKVSIPQRVISWTFKNAKFLLVPGSRFEELSLREFEYERSISKRKFMPRMKNVLTIIGICIIFFIITLAVFGPWIAPQTFADAMATHPGSWDPPSPEHPLGQTVLGGDVLSRLIYGARTSLTIALPSITISVVGGIIFGVIAAYYGGWVDSLIMRICDIFLAFPSLILSLVFIAIYGPYIEIILLVWGFLGIPYYARLIRGNVLQTRTLPYVEAARVAGAGNWRIMFRHILPNCIQPIIISFTFDIGGVILGLAGLSFLGFNQSVMIEWGNDVNIARSQLIEAPWAALWPGFMIFITVLGFMLFGDGLRDALDPRMKNL
ncbi:MAG: ABC transporter permease [Promethearchaeota archaeon]|nr:MAG: ABC transporter permease [Candidatus Lokiarchaeota archaeon]